MYIDKIKTFLKKLNLPGIVFIYILLRIMPIVPRATSTFLTTYSYMLIVVVAVVFSFITCRLGCIKEYMMLLFPFVIYEGLELVLLHSDNEVLLSGYKVLLFLLPVCLGYYLITHVFYTEMYTILLMVIIGITCVTTIIGCIKYPDASRTLATTESSQDIEAIIYDWNNIGGYNFVYTVVLLYPFVILAFKMKKLPLVFVIVYIVLIFYMVVQAEYTYALLMLMLSSMLFFIKRDIPLKKFLLLMLVFILIVLVFRVAIASVLSYFGELIGNQKMVDKINAAFLGTESVENFDDNRDELYKHSIEMFFKSPFFGSLFGGRKITGGHSFILDNLALYGLVGGGLMILMYRGIYMLFVRPMKDKVGYYIVFWIFLQTIVLSAINTGMWLNNLCMYSPIFICAIYGNDAYISVVKPAPTPLIPVNTLKSKGKKTG